MSDSFCVGCVSSNLTDKRQPNASSDALPALCCTPDAGEVEQSTTEAIKTTAMMIRFIKSNKNRLEHWDGEYQLNKKKRPVYRLLSKGRY